MHNQHHPELELLDRLRAGLLDGQPEEKAALERHLATCRACRSRFEGWQQLGPAALGPRLDPGLLHNDLRKLRHRALGAAGSGHHWSITPYATAALLLIAASAGLWSLQQEPAVPPQLAVQDTQDVPDLYEDLDFYLWLADHENGPGGEDNGAADNT